MNPPTYFGGSYLNLHNSQVKSARDLYFNTTYRSESSVDDPYRSLENWTVLDALFDSEARYDPPQCHPDTRTAVLAHIREWASNPESHPIMWIRGGAGAGKSAIAQTLSEGWDKDGILAASFYLSREAADRNEKRYIIATLAYQIASSIPSTRQLIEDAIRRVPRIFERNLGTQMKQLIVNPLLLVAKNEAIDMKIVVIDGLDECCNNYSNQDFEQQQKEILESIHSALEHKGLPLRFLISSRPERQIREIFDHGLLAPFSSRITLDDTYNPAADIELYLEYNLKRLRRIHPHLGSSWPPEGVLPRLVAKSSGHFIYAAVVVRHLSSPRTDPDAGLKTVMGLDSGDKEGPFAELDLLYSHILHSVEKESMPTVMNISSLLIYSVFYDGVFTSSIAVMSPCFVAKFLFLSLGQLYLHLIDLHSILDIPPEDASRDAPIKFLHESFSEYLRQSHRSKQFSIDSRVLESVQRFLPFCIRHFFTQILSPDCGKGEGYSKRGFAILISVFLLFSSESNAPDEEILRALRALLDSDENETEFIRHVHQLNLAHLGTTRKSMELIQSLYSLPDMGNTPRRPVVFEILKKYPVRGYVPIDPAKYEPERYRDALTWLLDTYQGPVSEPDCSSSSKEESTTLDSAVEVQTDLVTENDQSEDPIHEVNKDLPSLSQGSERIQFIRDTVDDGTLPREHPKDPGSLSEPQEHALTTTLDHQGAAHLDSSGWHSREEHSSQKGTSTTLIRQIAGVGLRAGSPVVWEDLKRKESRNTCVEDVSWEMPD